MSVQMVISDIVCTLLVLVSTAQPANLKHVGLFPEPVSLGVRADIWTNNTCGVEGPETYCRLTRAGKFREGQQCGVCDSRSPDKRHPADYAIDTQQDTWWQSSTLVNGHHLQFVTLTIDLKQIYQVLYVRVRAGPSPRPGNWILERSLDGEDFEPWQYFAISSEECWVKYGLKSTNQPLVRAPDQPACVTAFSKVSPFEGGEIYASLTQGWGNASFYSPEVLKYTSARYIRFRFQKMSSLKFEKTRHGHGADMTLRLYYTIKDILVQGRCNCNGHASKCPYDPATGEALCECTHRTTGKNCEMCLPLYNQRPWKPGTSKDANHCVKCECNGHATSCRYDPGIAMTYASDGQFLGGGVCNDCADHTTGVNCEKCEDGWYREPGVLPNATVPCRPCNCHFNGTTGYCYKDDSEAHLNKPAGACECREGFTGLKCDRCAPGYSNFPDCRPCPCDPRGWIHGTSCDKVCICKTNVEGERCEHCKPGYFFMERDDGSVECTECYCSGVKTNCDRAANYSVNEFMTMDGWQVSDLSTSYIVQPYNRYPQSRLISIADTQMGGLESYYWMAPTPYRGNKLTSYGSTISFSVSWDFMRGDTSGKETTGPDLVLTGYNGLRIGYGNAKHVERSLNITVPLVEDGWYHVLDGVKDIITRLRRNQENWEEYRGEDINRGQFLSVLANIKHVLVRAKFHTDQADGSLHSCTMEIGYEGGSGTSVGFIEKCFCPPGNTGLSCEKCDYGYTRVTEGISPMHKVVCSKCNCHGHSASCDPITGQCGVCEHQTTGSSCEKCIEGYYGDATNGSPNDCRKCACPIMEASNNFSPSCEADSLGYVCTACPVGYRGRHCEECAPGYFGNPEDKGSTCEPCNCNDGPCDHLTGRCLTCLGNTQGWKCDKCKPNHYGNATTTGCFPCECSEIGSLSFDTCNLEDGQCECKERFTSRTCDRCETGFGNVSAGCLPCECNSIGARSSLCDSITGACDCLPGITGYQCHTCLPEHYGYSENGCKPCNCHSVGSETPSCDLITGECICKSNVVGRTCNACKTGYWGHSQTGCTSCDCDILGSRNASCELETGQCYCKAGIGGLKCDHCLPHFYNMSIEGCSECEKCDLPGHICDPDTGACVCPPLTIGAACEICEDDAWGYHPQKGCKPCLCDLLGSFGGKCDPITGRCSCKEGYQGAKCQSCAKGYFGYPTCKKCGCDSAGTLPHHCQDGVCVCDSTGQCPCKENTHGLFCDQCKEGTFGLSHDNEFGCTECFCFGRSTVCTDAGLSWSSIRMQRPRAMYVYYDNDTASDNVIYPVNTQEICYINLAMPGDNKIEKKDEKQLNATNNLRIIPGDDGNVELGVSYWFDTPLYWQLPQDFLGDKILSYGGYLKFTVETKGGSTLFPDTVLSTYPLIQIQGNEKIVLEHFPFGGEPGGRNEVRFHESFWRMKNNPKDKVSRETFMVALQNLQHILIRASDSVDFAEARIREVSLDTAVERPGASRAASAPGIELCECPRNYNASSCQNPSIGYYRYKSDVSSTIIIDLVGEAKPCECNGRATACNMETGHCVDCVDRTGGPHCEHCGEGYYGDPSLGIECLPCPCPTVVRNFAVSCNVFPEDRICSCKTGYTGPYCDRCSYGWFGYPEAGGTCKPCSCNVHGRVSDECDEKTGQCNCRPGVAGWDCSVCVEKMHVLTENGCSECTDECIVNLLESVYDIEQNLDNHTYSILSGAVAPPREPLVKMQTRLSHVEITWRQNLANNFLFESLQNEMTEELVNKEKTLLNKVKRLLKNRKLNETLEAALSLKSSSDHIIFDMDVTRNNIFSTVNKLKSYVKGDDERMSISAMLHEAKQILGRIRDTDLETKRMESERLIRCCSTSLNDLKYIGDRHEIELLYKRLKTLTDKIGYLREVAYETQEKRDIIEELIRRSQNLTNSLKKKNVDIEILLNDNSDTLNSSYYLNEVTKVYLLEAEDNSMGLVSLKDTLDIARRAVEERSSLLKEDKRDLTQYVIAAFKHADDLMEKTETYANWFKADTDAAVAMKASKAYQEIIDALTEAKYAVDNATLAADIAYEKAYPGVGTESLVDQAIASKTVSVQLKNRAQLELNNVQALLPELDDFVETMEDLTKDAVSIDTEEKIMTQQFNELENSSSFVKNISIDTVSKCNTLIEKAEEVEDEIFSLNHNITTKLKPKLDQLEADGEISLNIARELIDDAQANSKQAQDIVDRMSYSFGSHKNQFEKWNDTIAMKLDALRNKITQAHHIANSIRLSMTSIGDSGGTCVRTYQPANLEPSTMTSIVLTYAISSQPRDALLFYLPSSTTEDFVAIEMVNRKMRFAWNLGSGLGEVTHPLHIQTAGDLNKDQHWYRVEAQRISNVGHLWVRPVVVPDGSPLGSAPPATNASTPGFGLFDVNPGDRVWVGGADKRHPHLLSTQSGLVGCLHHLYLNGRPIGLWDFSTQNPNSCTACVEGAQEVKDETAYSFSGDGYAVLKHEGSGAYNKYLFSVSLSFRSFDANALLFLGLGNDTEKYVSLTLINGRVVFKIGYGGESSLEMTTMEKYNTGKWIRLEASRYYDRKKKLEKGVLKVGKEVRDGAPTMPPNQESIPDMSAASYYVGGIPPGLKMPLNLPGSLLGCMSDLQIDQGGYSLLKGTFWGVQSSCPNKPITTAGFYGRGYIELAAHPLKRKDSFGFVFSTSQRDALLMLSTFEGLNGPPDDNEEMTNLIEQEQDRLSYYSVSLRRGAIDVRLNAGRGEVRLASVSSEYGDSKFHSVSVAKIGRRLELRVDDVLDAITTLPEGSASFRTSQEEGGLFFGGLPTGFNTTGRTFSTIPLVGTIKDVIFNDNVFGFEQPVRFEEMTIGRPGPSTAATNSETVRSPSSTGCRKVSSYSLEPGAVKFGDMPFSHLQINFRKRAMFQKNFTIHLDFRTFYQNGLIFVIPGVRGKQPHYLMAALRNGRVQIVTKGRRKIETTAQAVFNDGVWHKLVLEKQDRKMTLRVDSIDPEKTKIPKRMNVGSVMYIGGLPETGVTLPNPLLQKQEHFKGCIRHLIVNDHEEPLIGDNSSPSRVGQCFPQVERGSYFPGDAFAIYKNKFDMGSLLELELEFRTSEMNGILLSVSEPQGYPALSLELNNGKVILSGDMGDRRLFRVVQDLGSEYILCDNRWHRIQAQYINDQLTLRVDQQDQSYWLSDNGHLTEAHTNSPLFIGGLPDQTLVGTLETKENFKGCIRNVIINGERRDWTAMAGLRNILLSSCPLAS